jgi:hypothetical protein
MSVAPPLPSGSIPNSSSDSSASQGGGGSSPSWFDYAVSAATFGLYDPSQTPSASGGSSGGGFFSGPINAAGQAAGNVLDAAGNDIGLAGDAVSKAARSSLPVVAVAVVGVIALSVAAIYVAHKL